MTTPVPSQKLINEVLQRDDFTCRDCGKKGQKGMRADDMQVHHIIPRHMDGSNSLDNLVTLCRACHQLQVEGTLRRRPGRPPLFVKGTMKNCHILLPLAYVAAAERLGNGNMAEGVRLALEPHVEQAEQEGAK